MLSSFLVRACLASCLAVQCCALVVRDIPGLNSTTTIDETPIATEICDAWCYCQAHPKECNGRSHDESTAAGLSDEPLPTPTTQEGSGRNTQGQSSSVDDVASIILSVVASPEVTHVPIIQTKQSGWGQDATAVPVQTTNGGVQTATERRGGATEVSKANAILIPAITPVPATNIVVGGQTLTPGGSTATVGEGDGATKIHLDESGAPIVVVGAQTSTAAFPALAQVTPAPTVIEGQTLMPGGAPITVGSGPQATTFSISPEGETVAVVGGATSTVAAAPAQVFTIGGVTATIKNSDYQYQIASSILAVGHPVTISGTVISLTTDAAGFTLLIAGDLTTTLANLAQTTAAEYDSGVRTTFSDGTAQYIIGSETLAPDHPITVNGVPISIATSGGNTVLVIGTRTTTLRAPAATDLTSETAVATQGSAGGGQTPAAATSKKGAAPRVERWGIGVACVVILEIAILGLG